MEIRKHDIDNNMDVQCDAHLEIKQKTKTADNLIPFLLFTRKMDEAISKGRGLQFRYKDNGIDFPR